MASYKYIRHTAAEIDEAIEQEREHCANEASHTCQEEKDRWNGAAELAEENKSDILSIRTDVNDIIPKLSTVSVTSDAENNWYRIFQANQKQTSRSGIIMINRAYSNLAPESYTLFFNFAHSDNVFRLITKKVENHKIDKIRLVYKKTSQQEYPCYIDIRYNGTKLNQINVSMHCESAALTGTGSTFKNRKFVKSDFSVAEIPEDYTSYEFDLTGKDVFDRLTALETALSQTQT